MADTMGGAMFLDPEVEAMVLAFFCLLSIILVSLLIWLIFICLRVDRTVHWAWSIVFIPLWIVDVFILWGTIYRMRHYDAAKNDELNQSTREEEAEEDENEETDGLLGSRTTKNTKTQHLYNQYIPFIQCCLLLVFQVLIALRLDGYLKVNVAVVFIPFYLYEIMNTIKNGKQGWSTRCFVVVQVTCVLLQLEYIKKDYSWFIVFIPFYFLGLFNFFKLYLLYKKFGGHLQGPEARQGRMLVMVCSVIYGVLAILFYTVLGLIARRLDGTSNIRLSVILIPVFIILVSLFGD